MLRTALLYAWPTPRVKSRPDPGTLALAEAVVRDAAVPPFFAAAETPLRHFRWAFGLEESVELGASPCDPLVSRLAPVGFQAAALDLPAARARTPLVVPGSERRWHEGLRRPVGPAARKRHGASRPTRGKEPRTHERSRPDEDRHDRGGRQRGTNRLAGIQPQACEGSPQSQQHADAGDRYAECERRAPFFARPLRLHDALFGIGPAPDARPHRRTARRSADPCSSLVRRGGQQLTRGSVGQVGERRIRTFSPELTGMPPTRRAPVRRARRGRRPWRAGLPPRTHRGGE